MGDVLVYVDPPVNDRLLAFARPLADAAGGALVALVASGEPTDAGSGSPRPTWCSRCRTRRSRPTSRKRTRRCSRRRSGARARPRRCSRTPRPATTSGAAAAAAAGLPFVGYCVGLSLEGGEAQSTSGIYGGQLQATVRTPLPAVFAINSVALHEEPQAPGAASASSSPPPAELDSLRTTFVEAGRAAGRGRRPHDGRSDRLRRPRDRGRREHRPSRRSWPPRWAPSSRRRGRSSTRAGYPRRGRSASRARR